MRRASISLILEVINSHICADRQGYPYLYIYLETIYASSKHACLSSVGCSFELRMKWVRSPVPPSAHAWARAQQLPTPDRQGYPYLYASSKHACLSSVGCSFELRIKLGEVASAPLRTRLGQGSAAANTSCSVHI
ncbi:hypothetical protein Taro_054379 [Colocasia esculenta]|uniref:Uncharacterized protein n=1 Tax=Colocasia esculenta TaxID=4460 RepID=A0A843XQI1_COLES|nr:hypothetical protein [Colocasia esculenta]